MTEEELLQLASDIQGLAPEEQQGVANILVASGCHLSTSTKHGVHVNVRWLPEHVLVRLREFVRYYSDLSVQEDKIRDILDTARREPAACPTELEPPPPPAARVRAETPPPLHRADLDVQWSATLRRYLRLSTLSRKL